VAIIVLIVTMLFKKRLENLFRAVNVSSYKKDKTAKSVKDRQSAERRGPEDI
jgi:hypothetical protein